MRRIQTIALLILGLIFLSACDDIPDIPGVPTPDTLPDLEEGVWSAFAGSDGTACADDSNFEYFAYPGTLNKVVIDFEGGGICLNGATCSFPNSNPGPNNEMFYQNVVDRETIDSEQGIYDRDNPDNPLKDWYHVFVPYCTGDLHLGDNEATYTSPANTEFTVQHKGAVNARSVLDWLFENFKEPESVFITGCSAGAYAAALYTEKVAEQYPEADIYQLGDCGAGIVSGGFAALAANSWQLTKTFPDTTFDETFTPARYVSTLAENDNVRMSQYNSLFDSTQTFFYALATQQPATTPGIAQEWSTQMLSSLEDISAQAEDFVSYTSLTDDNDTLADGTLHCILPRPNFYTAETQGTSFKDWLADFVNGEEVSTLAATPPEQP